MFIALGWRGVIAHYGTHGRIVHRWMHEEGWDGLVADRAAYRIRLQDRDRAFRLRAAKLGTGDPYAAGRRQFDCLGVGHHDQQQEALTA